MTSTTAAQPTGEPAPQDGGPQRSPLWEAGVGLLAAVLGAVVIIDAAGIRAPAGVQVVGPRVFPVAVGCMLAVLGLALAGLGLRHRIRHGPPHAAPALVEALTPDIADDIATNAASRDMPDLPPDVPPVVREGGRSVWLRTLLLLAALAAYALLLRPVGFVVASTTLFTAAAVAFGGRPVRGLIIGAALSVVVYIAFTRGLELQLPGLPGVG